MLFTYAEPKLEPALPAPSSIPSVPSIPNNPILPSVDLSLTAPKEPTELVATLNIVLIITLLVIAPSLVLVMTSFTRIVIVFAFLRTALGTQQSPPTQVLVSLALILTFFIMEPVATKSYEVGIKPYAEKKISYDEAFERAIVPFKDFMIKNTREKDLALFLESANLKTLKVLMMCP